MYEKILFLSVFVNMCQYSENIGEITVTKAPTEFDPKNILKYEYGKRVPGDHLAYHKTGEIPPMTPYYAVFINMSNVDASLEKKFTYLAVEYVSPISTIDINYNPDTTTITFYIKIPFQAIEYGYAAWALKKANRRRNNRYC